MSLLCLCICWDFLSLLGICELVLLSCKCLRALCLCELVASWACWALINLFCLWAYSIAEVYHKNFLIFHCSSYLDLPLHYSSFCEIRVQDHCLYKQVFGPLCNAMEYELKWCVGLFMLEVKRHREKMLKDYNTTTAHQQGIITTFFSSITSHTTSQWRATHYSTTLKILL